jgi:acetyl-CoA carboxylase biotin carboxyl carrier protein
MTAHPPAFDAEGSVPKERHPVELTHQDVAAILDLIERTDVEYLEVEVGGTRIVADRSGATSRARAAVPAPAPPAAPPAPPAPPAAPAPPVPPAPPAPPAPGPAPAAAAAPHTAPPVTTESGAADLVTVTAPMVGVFYRAPEPGAPPFAEVGSRVEEGATVGLVEVMKMFNSVSAPVAGEVVEVLAGNDEFVEFGQPLFRLRPA